MRRCWVRRTERAAGLQSRRKTRIFRPTRQGRDGFAPATRQSGDRYATVARRSRDSDATPARRVRAEARRVGGRDATGARHRRAGEARGICIVESGYAGRCSTDQGRSDEFQHWKGRGLMSARCRWLCERSPIARQRPSVRCGRMGEPRRFMPPHSLQQRREQPLRSRR